MAIHLSDITALRLRANPEYELLALDCLPRSLEHLRTGLCLDQDCYGILRPKTKSLRVKSISHQVASLFLSLRQPRCFSEDGVLFCNHAPEKLVSLILDGVLEMASGVEFISGPLAYDLLVGRNDNTAHGVLPALSLQAVKYACLLDIDDCFRLSAKLYFYNRFPLSPYWASLFSSNPGLGTDLSCKDSARHHSHTHWTVEQLASNGSSWEIWRTAEPLRNDSNYITYKLYVSPQPLHMEEALLATIDTFIIHKVQCFKVASDVYGALRPDKLVAYFCNVDELFQVAEHLLRRLEGMPAHGVPFSCSIDSVGLTSWGVDPPSTEAPFRWQGRSWRRWITDRLAVGIQMARSMPTSIVEPWQFALDRLCLEGIDTNSWTPLPGLWSFTEING